jgi:general secretion pathway protein L
LLGEFIDWWGQQLLDLVPPRLRRHATGTDGLIVDASSPGSVVLLRRRRGVEQRLAQARLEEQGLTPLRAALNGRPRSEPVLLRLPAERVLERIVTLPLAAERELDNVLGYEMERLTPFTAEEVFWGHALQERDRARGRLKLRLMFVPKASVAGLIDQLAALGGRPDRIETAAPDGPRVIRLAHAGVASGSVALSTRNLAAAAAVLFLLVLASPFLRQSLALAEVQDRLDGMASRIEQVEALRRRIAAASAGGDAVAAETRRVGDTLEALAALTDILPDDSYLTDFTMRERKMTLSGLGASAPKLISGLSADPRIRNPAFTAPVTRSETNHLDVFSIRAELASR